MQLQGLNLVRLGDGFGICFAVDLKKLVVASLAKAFVVCLNHPVFIFTLTLF